MKTFFTIILTMVLIIPQGVSADPIDPDINVLGLYFDEGATQVCAEAAPFTMVPFWVILTNPDFDLFFDN